MEEGVGVVVGDEEITAEVEVVAWLNQGRQYRRVACLGT
jgi:hypothetical protein